MDPMGAPGAADDAPEFATSDVIASGTDAGEPKAINPNRVMVAAMASLGAGLVHAAAAGTHGDDRALVMLFGATALAQVAWAWVATNRRTTGVLLTGVVINGGAVLAWALSRTVGLPWPSSLEEVEAVGTQDLLAAILGGLAVAAAIAAMVPSRPRALSPARLAVGGLLALGLTFSGVVAQHTHGGAGHAHGEGEVADGHADGHAHGEGETASAGHDHGATGDEPYTSVDDERLTKAQRAAAVKLIEDTTAGMAAFTDQAAVEAAGYRSIGDQVTGYEHFINFGYLRDGIDVDPTKIESVVFEVKPDGTKRVATAMYILSVGETMADAPDIAGPLTTWHDHQDLCWGAGGKVVGLFRDGKCSAGTLVPTPPMLHVWMIDHPCGPFSGLEGHGGDCTHSHGGETEVNAATEAATGTAAAGGHHHAPLPARLDHDPTEAQRRAARKLIADTERDTAQFATVAAAQAAGYESIHDSMTGVEHFVNPEYSKNDTILDSKQIESLVYKVLPDGGRELITAMYLMPFGSTMDDVPDIAGNLTVWHDHQNLCWDESRQHLRGIVINGTCVPGGTFGATAPMLHVWVTPNKCGPFAGTDGGQMTGSCTTEDV
jgi:hypothetical protein